MSFSIALRRDANDVPDFTIRGGKLRLSIDADAVRDRVYTALSTQLAEWFLDNRDGLPYINGILGGRVTQAEAAALIRRRILLEPDVDRIESLDLSQDGRQLRVSAVIWVSLPEGSETIEVTV